MLITVKVGTKILKKDKQQSKITKPKMKTEEASIIEMKSAARTAIQHIYCQLWKIINWITTKKNVDHF